MSQNVREIAGFIWTVADELLRDNYKRSEYADVIYPFTVIRRLDLILEPTHEQVHETQAKYKTDLKDLTGVLTKASGYAFYNTSKYTISNLLNDPGNIKENFLDYLNGYSDNVQEIIEKFDFRHVVQGLHEKDMLYMVIKKFADPKVTLHPNEVTNHEMGYVFEELIRKYNEATNENPGEHFTPREIVRLMVKLLITKDKEKLSKPGIITTVYDPTAGTGGMLSVSKEKILELNSKAKVEVFGQENNDKTYAACKADMLIKGEDPDKIKPKSSFSKDGFIGKHFDYIFSNPPYGKKWSYDEEFIRNEAKLGDKGRFGAGLPGIDHGQLLFLQHMISKMHTDGNQTRIAIVFDGSPLFNGESGCGKSALLAEWVARWNLENPEDFIIQHYMGSTPESADWQGLVRRILGELKRAYAITDELPMQPDALRTAMQDWLVKAAGSRRVVILLDALNQLSGEDASARQLGWLPFALPPNIRLIVSSLPGESLDALRKRGWNELDVPLFARDDIAPAARAYFDIFSKKLPKEILVKIENTAAAANALYLRAVLDELRQFGIHEELEAKASGYLSAPDLQTLFDRILTRWHEDFGQDGEYPDLVRRILSLIACSRFGLSEAELLDLLGKKNTDGKYEPLPRRPWTPFYLAAENALVQRSGLLTFGHDYLRAAVHRSYLADGVVARSFQLQLACYFGRIPEPTDRKLDELPTLLRDTDQWNSLKDLLADLPTFERLRNHRRWEWEVLGFWLAIGGRYDPVEVYRVVLAEAEPNISAERLPYFLNMVGIFYEYAGHYEGAEPLFRRALEGSERVLGKEHPDTLTSMSNLALLLKDKGDYKGAEPLLRRALEVRERVHGQEHPDTLISVNNLAAMLYGKGDYEGAEPLFHRALEVCERVLGSEHSLTLTSVNNLAVLLYIKGDYEDAEPLFRRALEAYEHVLGKEHPDTLTIMNNLAELLRSKGDYEGAKPLYCRALDVCERVLGKEHPDTLTSVNNLAVLLYIKGDYEDAELLYRRALEGICKVSLNMGGVHSNLKGFFNNYAGCLRKTGMNEVQVIQRLKVVLKSYGFNWVDFYAP